MLGFTFVRAAAAGLTCACLVGATGSNIEASSAGRSTPGEALARARLLVIHGEPGLALDALQRGDAVGTDAALSVRVLTESRHFAQADSLLARAASPGDRRSAFLHHLQRARLNHDAGRADECLRLLREAGSSVEAPFRAYRDLLGAEAFVATGAADSALEWLQRARKNGYPDALRGPMDRARLRAYRSAGALPDALAAANDAVASAEDARMRRTMLDQSYTLARETGNVSDATRTALRLFREFPNTPEAERCAVGLLEWRADLPNGTLMECADVLATRGRTADLRVALRVLDARSLSDRETEASRLAWAQYHYQTRDYSRAIALARPSYSDPGLRRRSMLVMARSLRKLSRHAAAARVYERLALDYPNDALAAEALYAAADLYDQAGDARGSSRILDGLRRSYPSTFHGWAAAMARASRLAEDGFHDQAIEIYNQWLIRSRRTDEAALFYLARETAATRGASAGEMVLDELRRLNPYSFYMSPDVQPVSRLPVREAAGSMAAVGSGSLAEWLGQVDEERARAYERVRDAAASLPEGRSAEAGRAIERGVWFLGSGFRDWGEWELDAANRHASAEQMLEIARVYESYAMPWRSVRLYERARSTLPWPRRKEHADDFRYLTYPVPYPAQVFDGAARNGIEPHLVYGLIREESLFEADAVSRAGAVGLMQLMPETAKRVASQIDLDLDIDALDDPAVNVTLGVWYAADLLADGKGSAAWMLAAYNAGPGAANRWIDPGVSGARAIDEVESISYKETRGYVKRVIESANVYHALYFGGGPKGAADRGPVEPESAAQEVHR